MAGDKVDAAARSFVAAQKKLTLADDRGAKATEGRENDLLGAMDGRHVSRVTTGRSDLWGIRCRPGLKESMAKLAHARGIPLAQLVEELCDAALAAKRGGKQ
jgi:hypothetical protein